MMSRERKHLFLECAKGLKFGKNNKKGFIHQAELGNNESRYLPFLGPGSK